MKRTRSHRKKLLLLKFNFVALYTSFLILVVSLNCVNSAPENPTYQGSSSSVGAQGRQLSPASNYDSSQRMKPMAVASARDATVTYNNNNNNNNNQAYQAQDPYTNYNNLNSNAAITDPYQLTYSPSASSASAYYYQHYPNYSSKHKYGPFYGSGPGQDFSNQKTLATPQDAEQVGFFEYMKNYFFPPTEADSKTDPVSLAGLAALAVSSLSGLSWVAIALAIVLAPVLIPLIVSPLIFLLILVYFFPVIKLDIPGEQGAGRRGKKSSSIWKHLGTTAHFYKRMAQSDECLERLTCEIASYARGNYFEEWITKKIEKSSNKWLHRLSRSLKAAQEGQHCQIYSCNPNLELQKTIGVTNNLD